MPPRRASLVGTPNLLSARSRGGGGGDGDGNDAWYGIAASAVALLLFCALAASVSVWVAFLCLVLVSVTAAGCLARGSCRVGASDDAVTAEQEAAGEQRLQRRFGLPQAAIDALPTFAYAVKGGGDGDLESGAGNEPCPVCLEDFKAGEAMRQLPTCKHLFHVDCIDMWLHTHRTCPVCRCNLSPPPKLPAKAAEVPAEEAERPAGDALPPV
ncbi:hypothetical protein ACP70R_029370 [Stipagrostis hirtigluma subsp. patula]